MVKELLVIVKLFGLIPGEMFICRIFFAYDFGVFKEVVRPGPLISHVNV